MLWWIGAMFSVLVKYELIGAGPDIEYGIVMWLNKLFGKSSPPVSESSAIPTVTPTVIAEARKHANGCLYAIDGIADPNGAVPPERIRGAWKVNANGEIEGAFIPNPNYRPVERTT
jgi:hypothetical protein